MQRDQHLYPNRVSPPFVDCMGNNYMDIPFAPAFDAVSPLAAKPSPSPFHGVEFHSSEVCPKNFIIFDQTDQRSQIMFNPSIARSFNGPNLNFCATYLQENFEWKDANKNEREMSSSLKEDSADIDALLSMEEEEEEYDEDEISTGRYYGNDGSDSPDSVSSYGMQALGDDSPPSKLKSGGGSSNSNFNRERKCKKMKKMVNMLKGIVPGGNQMNTVAVLDEAVKYLKSLKVEVQKHGIGDAKN